jgi:hypothetical protein
VTRNEGPAIEHIQRVRIYEPRGHDTHRMCRDTRVIDTEPSQPGGYGRDVGMPSLSIGISSNMTSNMTVYDLLTLETHLRKTPRASGVITDLGAMPVSASTLNPQARGVGSRSGAEPYRRTLGDEPPFFPARIRPHTHTLWPSAYTHANREQARHGRAVICVFSELRAMQCDRLVVGIPDPD